MVRFSSFLSFGYACSHATSASPLGKEQNPTRRILPAPLRLACGARTILSDAFTHGRYQSADNRSPARPKTLHRIPYLPKTCLVRIQLFTEISAARSSACCLPHIASLYRNAAASASRPLCYGILGVIGRRGSLSNVHISMSYAWV